MKTKKEHVETDGSIWQRPVQATHTQPCRVVNGDSNGKCSCQPTHTPTYRLPWIHQGEGRVRTPVTNVSVATFARSHEAAYAVRAVNAYQPMLDALKFAADTLETGKLDPKALMIFLDQAIAKAEGR